METELSFEQSLQPGGPHHTLHAMIGEWKGMTRTWFEPGETPSDENEWHGTIKSFLDGRYVLHEYDGKVGNDLIHGYCLFAYNLVRRQYEAAWVDSFHTGNAIMFSVGTPTEKGFSVLGSYSYPGSPDWGWRTVVEISGADQIIITAYNITPAGEEMKGVETIYKRTGR